MKNDIEELRGKCQDMVDALPIALRLLHRAYCFANRRKWRRLEKAAHKAQMVLVATTLLAIIREAEEGPTGTRSDANL